MSNFKYHRVWIDAVSCCFTELLPAHLHSNRHRLADWIGKEWRFLFMSWKIPFKLCSSIKNRTEQWNHDFPHTSRCEVDKNLFLDQFLYAPSPPAPRLNNLVARFKKKKIVVARLRHTWRPYLSSPERNNTQIEFFAVMSVFSGGFLVLGKSLPCHFFYR